MKKTVTCILAFAAAAFLFFTPAFAAQTSGQGATQQYYEEQKRQSGADQLEDKLPADTRKALDELGIGGADWNAITSITPQNYFQKILSIFTGKFQNPLRVAVCVIAVILLCSLLNGMKLSFGEQQLCGVIGMVATLCICTIVVSPIVSCIQDAADMLKASSGFLLACIPVLAGILIAAGQPVTAGSYNLLMLAAGNAVSIFSANFLVPMMNIFLALSVVSAVSPNISLSGLCSALNKAVKWIMGLCMTLFTGLITVHSLVSTSADNTGGKAAKFIVSSFVPVVGNALGEALNTVNGCIKLLKSGVGAFGLLAGMFLFLPVIAECILWVLTLSICSGIGQIFELREVTSLLKASSDVVSTMLAILLCCMTVLVISTVLMLVIGGMA